MQILGTPLIKSRLKALLSTVAFGLSALYAIGQFYPPMTIDASLAKFLSEDCAFSANLEVTSRAAAYRWPVRVALLNGMTRVDMDISKMQEDQKEGTWTNYVGNMQKAGSAESVSIFNPTAKALFIVLPHLKAYMEQPIPEDALAELKKRPQAKRTELGTEAVDGHVCVKTKVSFNKENMDVWRTWETPAAVIWSRTNSPSIPVRIQVLNSVGQTNCTLIFSDVVLKKPDPAAFRPTKGFTKLDQDGLMKRIMENWPKDE